MIRTSMTAYGHVAGVVVMTVVLWACLECAWQLLRARRRS